MQVLFNNCMKISELEEKRQELLLSPLVNVIKQFYQVPENRAKYEIWLKQKTATNDRPEAVAKETPLAPKL